MKSENFEKQKSGDIMSYHSVLVPNFRKIDSYFIKIKISSICIKFSLCRFFKKILKIEKFENQNSVQTVFRSCPSDASEKISEKSIQYPRR